MSDVAAVELGEAAILVCVCVCVCRKRDERTGALALGFELAYVLGSRLRLRSMEEWRETSKRNKKKKNDLFCSENVLYSSQDATRVSVAWFSRRIVVVYGQSYACMAMGWC